ncbi:tyrosine-type recombinase/integrase [Methylobacterium sp. SI9]|uniref:tyrosine-type recombinase/integrase n=1 Tax=Methylobacterium guangdongense TaxID=3138811 RepID=UPI00313DDF1E
MVAKVLTMQSVQRLKPQPERRIEIPDAALPGFYLVVQPSGAKSWAVRYRIAGKPRKYTIGPYPLFDLSAAREAGREALQMVARGKDPIVEKQAAMEAAQAAERGTVRAVVDEYVQRHLKPNSGGRHAAETEAMFRNHILPRWGERRMGEITRKDVIALTDALVDSGLSVGANRVFSGTRALFNWAFGREIIETTPFLKLKLPVQENSRVRVLNDEEVRFVWQAAERVGYPFGTLVQFLLLTAQRRDEVARMTWRELEDKDGWLLPGARTKNGREHLVPLPKRVMAIIESVPRLHGSAEFVLTTDGRTPSSNYGKNKKKLDAVMLDLARKEADAAGRDADKVDVPHWTLHDLRRTGSTGMARLGFPIHVTEAVLNHASGAISGVAAIYNRYQYLEEKRAALEAWAQFVEVIVGEAADHG